MVLLEYQWDVEGVYSRMYRAMADHKQGLMSFDEMLKLWKEEARMIRELLQKESVKAEEVRVS